jgi:hypothetical protein
MAAEVELRGDGAIDAGGEGDPDEHARGDEDGGALALPPTQACAGKLSQ